MFDRRAKMKSIWCNKFSRERERKWKERKNSNEPKMKKSKESLDWNLFRPRFFFSVSVVALTRESSSNYFFFLPCPDFFPNDSKWMSSSILWTVGSNSFSSFPKRSMLIRFLSFIYTKEIVSIVISSVCLSGRENKQLKSVRTREFPSTLSNLKGFWIPNTQTHTHTPQTLISSKEGVGKNLFNRVKESSKSFSFDAFSR